MIRKKLSGTNHWVDKLRQRCRELIVGCQEIGKELYRLRNFCYVFLTLFSQHIRNNRARAEFWVV